MGNTVNKNIHDSGHDHAQCVADAIVTAREICDSRGSRFTPIRKRVLELIWSGHHPITAYEVLDLLSKESKKTVAPPTVYRALDFLIEEGFIHKLESLNAFVGCPDPEHSHQGHFLICQSCSIVQEISGNKLSGTLSGIAKDHGFSSKKTMLEILGLCSSCKDTE